MKIVVQKDNIFKKKKEEENFNIFYKGKKKAQRKSHPKGIFTDLF